MGILDEAIREHLELKRQHGAEEKEIEGLESEAFGPADRPDAVEPETRILSPEEAAGQAAGKVEGELPADSPEASATAGESFPVVSPPAPEPTPEPSPASESSEPPAAEAKAAAEAPPAPVSEEVPPSPVKQAEAEPTAEPEPEIVEPPEPELEGDAGDMLEAERQRLSSHPTEHYDVDAAIAEEDELDVLSESSLSDELDRALEGPAEPASTAAPEPHSAEEPVTAEPPADHAEEDEAEAEFEELMETSPEDEPDGPASEEFIEADEDDLTEADEPADEDEPDEDDPAAAFFDQEDPLEGTPDFLEETPDHDRLWFEQKEPKDFDFGD